MRISNEFASLLLCGEGQGVISVWQLLGGMEESDVERGHEFEAAAVEAPALHTSPLLQSEAVNEGVTCRQALKAAKEQCLKIRSFSMLLKYIYDHRYVSLALSWFL